MLEQFVGLILLLILGISIVVLVGSALVGRRLHLRPLHGYQALPVQLGRVIEEGQSLHLCLGSGGAGGSDTATTLAGLAVLDGLAEESAATDVSPLVTVADPTTLMMAQDILRRAYARQGNPKGYDPTSVRYVAAAPLPYAAGVMELLSGQEASTNVMAGVFGAEAALIADQGAQLGLTQIAGVADPAALSVLYPAVNHLAVGEEMFSAGAYLRGLPAHIASLRAQDIARGVLFVFILLLAVPQALSKLLGG